MILYFTGTGNSKFAADFLAESLGDECLSLNEKIKKGEDIKENSEKPYIVVAPIHAWRFPLKVEEIVKRAELKGSRKIYFVGTMGENSGKTDTCLKKLCGEKGLEFMGFCGVKMQNNYLIGDVMPNKAVAEENLHEVIPALESIAEKIKNGEKIEKTDKTPFTFLVSGVVNKFFTKFAGKYMKPTASDKCGACGICAEFCPVNNIEIKDGKAQMGEKCISCFGCIHRCPTEAVNIEGKTEKNGRYLCPEYSQWKKAHE
ncbi:MAG TPA: EFR1 family ferrodoxin [Clostridiales bacterium]|nr:EFR1 family ferrodoxin [Clostridiales bacterium]HXK82771.1 EFR1 family ferrodoxin [Clostridiales bacterium]